MSKTFIRQMIRHWAEYRPLVEAAGLEFRIVSRLSSLRVSVQSKLNVYCRVKRTASLGKLESPPFQYTPDQPPFHSSGGVSGISNAAEAAIWLVDYALHAACLGLKRLHFHHRVGQS
jgi:hypothetical protein